MKINVKQILILVIILLCIIGGFLTFKILSDKNNVDETFQIRFSDLVSLESLEKYNNKTVTAVGFLATIMSYDGSFGYLMNLPYQTCPYCQPSDTRITNTIAIFAKEGERLVFTDSTVLVTGTLKLESYTDPYGYTYNYRLIDVTVVGADTSELDDKLSLYNQLADRNILNGILQTLYEVDNNVFYDEYISRGAEYERQLVNTEMLDSVINDLKDFNQSDVEILVNVSTQLKTIAINTNKLIEENNIDGFEQYKTPVANLFTSINNWMAEHEL